jgi:hypothetical protein
MADVRSLLCAETVLLLEMPVATVARYSRHIWLDLLVLLTGRQTWQGCLHSIILLKSTDVSHHAAAGLHVLCCCSPPQLAHQVIACLGWHPQSRQLDDLLKSSSVDSRLLSHSYTQRSSADEHSQVRVVEAVYCCMPPEQ